MTLSDVKIIQKLPFLIKLTLQNKYSESASMNSSVSNNSILPYFQDNAVDWFFEYLSTCLEDRLN